MRLQSLAITVRFYTAALFHTKDVVSSFQLSGTVSVQAYLRGNRCASETPSKSGRLLFPHFVAVACVAQCLWLSTEFPDIVPFNVLYQ